MIRISVLLAVLTSACGVNQLQPLALHAAEQANVTTPVDIFISGDMGINNYRIPAIVRTGTGTLLAFAEARTQQSDCDTKWIVYRRSVDNGLTWTSVRNLTVVPAPGTTGNPAVVFDAITSTVVVLYAIGDPQHCNPTQWTMVIDDQGSDGVVWGAPRNISSMLGPWAGTLPGPGTAAQLPPSSQWPGRLVAIAHYGAYDADQVIYSDDHGLTWSLSNTSLKAMDEAVVVALSNGSLMVNMRNDHLNKCDCRATSISDDGGATWSLPIQYDPTLISPVCQASLVSILTNSSSGDAAHYAQSSPRIPVLFFANPASKTDRANITIRRSDDNGATWNNQMFLASPGDSWGGYSCLAAGYPIWTDASQGGREYGGLLYERYNDAGKQAISFRLFPLDLSAV